MSWFSLTMHFTLAELTLVVICIRFASSQGETCRLNNIQVQAGFDPLRYLGKWYELKWVPGYFETEDTILVDYTETYSLAGDSFTALGQGRNGNTFQSFTKTYNKSDDAKYFNIRAYENTTIQVDYWIIATDYEHYSLVYGCTIPEQGVCMRAHAWMWSRQRVPEEKYYSIMKSHLPQLCLNESDFKILTQTFEIGDGTNTGGMVTPTGSAFQMMIILVTFYLCCILD